MEPDFEASSEGFRIVLGGQVVEHAERVQIAAVQDQIGAAERVEQLHDARQMPGGENLLGGATRRDRR